MNDRLVLLKKDILVEPVKNQEVNPSEIIVVDSEEKNEALLYFRVLVISDNVTMVREGDVIILQHGDHTPPVRWNGVLCAVTSEDDVVAVLEE